MKNYIQYSSNEKQEIIFSNGHNIAAIEQDIMFKGDHFNHNNEFEINFN